MSFVVRENREGTDGHCYTWAYLDGSTWTAYDDDRKPANRDRPEWDVVVTERIRIDFYEKVDNPAMDAEEEDIVAVDDPEE
jgi:hypothetical protein